MDVKNYASERFEGLEADKKHRIIEAAIAEFAGCGYDGANINKIASEAQISIGSLYSYFGSKKKLFLYLIDFSSALIEKELRVVNEEPFASVEKKIEKVLRIIMRTNREERMLIKLYIELCSDNSGEMNDHLSFRLETFSAQTYKKILEDGQIKGEVRADINPAMAAFHLDNIFMALQYSYTSEYLLERYQIYVKENITQEENDEFVIAETMKFLRAALLTS